ncbi:hypothetical protein OEB99_00030 [Actinotalea sp. M2MS4P-6]|uniref:hypothetical protein n=1 Tax=Actinotalea sp. M2MS4P-6 TaxID=2983762 RepID=UPI0021E3CFDE|nr:hypothetical protein [Actinotalea sp. M2MS4P-6]MCV2392684.1 hypothetical protein [Actinotalea sp. M2MS4P-6]
MWKSLRQQRDELEVAAGWLVIDPPGRFPGPVEHVLVGQGGVLAVARWSGDVAVTEGVLFQNGRRRELQSADLVREADALAGLLHKRHRPWVAPVVVARGDAGPVKVRPGLILVGADALAWTLEDLPIHFGPDDMADVVGRVAQARARRAEELPTQATLSAQLLADRAGRGRTHV